MEIINRSKDRGRQNKRGLVSNIPYPNTVQVKEILEIIITK